MSVFEGIPGRYCQKVKFVERKERACPEFFSNRGGKFPEFNIYFQNFLGIFSGKIFREFFVFRHFH
jgi:hypothetical protein